MGSQDPTGLNTLDDFAYQKETAGDHAGAAKIRADNADKNNYFSDTSSSGGDSTPKINIPDPKKNVPCVAHFKEALGWSHYAFQRVFGYRDFYDDLSRALGFNINGTKLDIGNYTIRLWKGTYFVAGTGGEIGLYNKNNGSMRKNDIDKLGIVSTEMNVFRKKDGSKVTGYKEDGQSFWTTAFDPFKLKHDKKEDIYTENTFYFRSEGDANDFYTQVNKSLEKGTYKSYGYNKGEEIIAIPNGNSVILSWGNMRDTK